jgi:putative ABC transport system permease protein
MAVAFILTSLGLHAMVHFITETRIKEIGIRKVNGARVYEILNMLNKDFVKWSALACIVAFPVAYYLIRIWLQSFAYQTPLSLWIFAATGLIVVGSTSITVTIQTLKSATRNPVEALRYE